MNRNRQENYEARLLEKHGAKSRWYKGKKGSKGEKEGRRKKVERDKKVVEIEDHSEGEFELAQTT